MPSKFLIYALQNPLSDNVYIGKSSSGLTRPRGHAYEKKQQKLGHLPIYKWIKKYRNQGVEFEITVLEELPSSQGLIEAEKFYIAYFKSIGMKLLNCTEGGEGILGLKHTLTTKAKISATHKGRVFSPERVAKMSEITKAQMTPERLALMSELTKKQMLVPERRMLLAQIRKGKVLSPESRDKLSKSLTGRVCSPETRKKLSESAQKRTPWRHTPEAKTKISQAGTGRKHTPEAKLKMSNSAKNRTPEHLAKLKEAQRNRPPASPETRQKMSISAKARGPHNKKPKKESI